MMFLLLKAVPVMRGWEDVRDEMGREPIRLFKGEYPNQICKGNGSALQVEK
jgi:hypothetical protein